MSEKNRDKLIEGILYYKKEIKNSSDKEHIEKLQKKIEEFTKQLRVTEFGDEVEYEKIDNDEIKFII